MSKHVKTRLIQKHDIEANWYTAGTAVNPFIPKQGEIIVYDDKDENGNIVADNVRFKIGDGANTVTDLPFVGGNFNLVNGTGKNSVQMNDCSTYGPGPRVLNLDNCTIGVQVRSLKILGHPIVSWDGNSDNLGWRINFSDGSYIYCNGYSGAGFMKANGDHFYYDFWNCQPSDIFEKVFVFEDNVYITSISKTLSTEGYYDPDDGYRNETVSIFDIFEIIAYVASVAENAFAIGTAQPIPANGFNYNSPETFKVGTKINYIQIHQNEVSMTENIQHCDDLCVNFEDGSSLRLSVGRLEYHAKDGRYIARTYCPEELDTVEDSIFLDTDITVVSISAYETAYEYYAGYGDPGVISLFDCATFKKVYKTGAYGDNSFVSGEGTTAKNNSEAAFGRFNKSTENTLFSVGNGTAESPSNALRIDNNGDIYIKNDSQKLATEEYVDSHAGGGITELPIASTTTAGIVQLNDDPTSADMTTAPTSHALQQLQVAVAGIGELAADAYQIANEKAELSIATETTLGGLYVKFDEATATLILSTTPITE